MHYQTPRRTIYLPIVRSALNDLLAIFDYPDPGMLTGQRASTTVAPQALFLMNSPFIEEQSTAFAKGLARHGKDDVSRLRMAYQAAFSRHPTDAETDAALAFLAADAQANEAAKISEPREAAWARLCQVLLASNDFLYVN